MNSKNTQIEIPVQCQESLKQFQAVMQSLITMTRQLLANVSEVDIEVMDVALSDRLQLLNIAQAMRDKFVQWKNEQRISDQWKQLMMPLAIELFHADEQLMIAVRQRKHEVVERLAVLHRLHNLERYVR